MTAIRGSISITTVDDGSTYNSYIACTKGVPFQYYKEGAPYTGSDWTQSANQPEFKPVVIAGGSEVQNILTSVEWWLDAINDGTKFVNGQGCVLDTVNGTPRLKLTSNICSDGASHMIYMVGTVIIDGVPNIVKGWISIEYKEASGDIADLVLTMSDNGVCKIADSTNHIDAVNGIKITATCYKGGATQTMDSFAWYAYNANDSDDNDFDTGSDDDWQDLFHVNAVANYPGMVKGPAAASGDRPQLLANEIWIPKEAIASSEKIKCVALKDATSEMAFCTVYDLSDPYIIEFTAVDNATGLLPLTNINAKNPAIRVTVSIKQGANAVSLANPVQWTVQDTAGAEVTYALYQTEQVAPNRPAIVLAYANTKGHGTILINADTNI